MSAQLDWLFLSSLARKVRRRNLTYLNAAKLRVIEADLRRIRSRRIEGDYLECGVALGGSGILIAKQVSAPYQFHGYDVFGMIPPPGPEDDPRSHARYDEISRGGSAGIGGDTYYGYLDNLYGRVCAAFAAFGMPVDGRAVQLHRGLFEETLGKGETRPVAFAHIDCDWHAPVAHCLDALAPRVPNGGRIVLDDYQDYGGCRRAVDAFAAAHPEFRLVRTHPSAALERI